MPKTAPIPRCSDDERKALEGWAGSRTVEARRVERARIILQCLEGKAVSAIARELKIRPNTVIDWRGRFDQEGIAGLVDRPRSGKPRQYTEEFRNHVLATLELPPPRGQAVWDGPALATFRRKISALELEDQWGRDECQCSGRPEGGPLVIGTNGGSFSAWLKLRERGRY